MMGENWVIILLAVLARCCEAQPTINVAQVALYGTCSMSAECPSNSSCKPKGCDGLVCYCDVGFFPSTDAKSCLKVAYINDACIPNIGRCAGLHTICAAGGFCSCISGLVVSSDDRNCVSPTLSLLNGPCGNTSGKACANIWEQECIDGTCTCFNGSRSATDEELLAFVGIFPQCREEAYSLDICNGTNITETRVKSSTMESQAMTTSQSSTTTQAASPPRETTTPPQATITASETTTASRAVTTPAATTTPTTDTGDIGNSGMQDNFPEEIAIPSIGAGILLIVALILVIHFVCRSRKSSKLGNSKTPVSSNDENLIIPPSQPIWHEGHYRGDVNWAALPEDDAVFVHQP